MKNRYFYALVISFFTVSFSAKAVEMSPYLATGTWSWQACESSLVAVEAEVDVQQDVFKLVRTGAWHRGQQTVVSYQIDLSNQLIVKEVADLVFGERAYAMQTNFDPANVEAYKAALVDMQYMVSEVLEQADYCQANDVADWQAIQDFLENQRQAL